MIHILPRERRHRWRLVLASQNKKRKIEKNHNKRPSGPGERKPEGRF
jgi:hypothetical protein